MIRVPTPQKCVRWLLRCVLGCALAWPVLARADVDACPTYNDILSLTLRESLDRVAPQMTEVCGDDAISTGLYGGLLLRAGAVADALVWLEKSLLLDPEQRGVRADYALALSSLGDQASSRYIATDLLQTGTVPEALTDVLDSLVSVDRWSLSGQFSVTGGYSDNIDYVTELSSLDLTFGEDGVTTLPLAEDSVPTQAGFFQQSITVRGLYQGGGFEMMPSVALRERRSAESEVSDYTSSEFGLSVSHRSTSVYLGLGATDYGFGLDRDDTRLGVSHALRIDPGATGCRPGVRAELWQQRYPEAASFDADLARFGVWLECDAGWQGGLFVTQDRAVGTRIGGDRSGFEAQLGRSVVLQTGQLNLDVSLSSEEDAEGYSDFLERGDARTLTTVRGSAEWLVRLSESMSVSTSLTLLRQQSNLALFDVSANELAVSLIYLPD